MKKFYSTLFIVFFAINFNFTLSQSLTDSLKAHYKFDQNLLDATTLNHDLEVKTGSVSYNLISTGDYSINFNGSSSIGSINIFDNSTFNNTAISLWLKSSTITSTLQICLQGAAIGFGVYIEGNTGKVLGFFDGSSAGSYTSSYPVTDGEWHHIVIQNNGSVTSMYIDGIYDGSISEPHYNGTGGSDNKLFSGKSNLNAYNYTGELNEVRIYNRLLSECEIVELYNSKKSPIVIYDFENSLVDSSGNNYNLQSIGSTPTYSLFASNDYAINFDGSTWLELINSFNNSTYKASTISMWVKSSTITTTLQICFQGASIGFGSYIQGNSGKMLGFFGGNSANAYVSTGSITDGNWHHIVIKNNSNKTVMYVDGVFNGSKLESMYHGTGASNNKFYLGKSNLNTYNFTGSLNEIYLYDRLLSECEVDSLFQSKTPTSISSINSNEKVELYPNPTNGKFEVKLEKNHNYITTELYDMSGKLISQMTFNNSKTLTFDISDRKNGVYFIKATTDDKSSKMLRVVKF